MSPTRPGGRNRVVNRDVLVAVIVMMLISEATASFVLIVCVALAIARWACAPPAVEPDSLVNTDAITGGITGGGGGSGGTMTCVGLLGGCALSLACSGN